MKKISTALFTGGEVVAMDPTRIRGPEVSSRHQSAFCGKDFGELKESIQSAGGNIQPILVRSKVGAEAFEVVFGERRHRACLELGLQVRVIIDESVDDLNAFFRTVWENQGRRELCAFEVGQQVKLGLARGYFASQEEASKSLGLHKSMISRAVAIASLPREIVSAYRSPNQIQYSHVEPLAKALEIAPDVVKAEALKIRGEGVVLKSSDVLQRLVNIASGKVASCNKPSVEKLEFAGKSYGTFLFDGKSEVRLKFESELSLAQQMLLQQAVQKFCSKSLKQPPARGVMNLRQADRLYEKLSKKLIELEKWGNRPAAQARSSEGG